MSGSQSWNFIHWDQTNPSKVYLFLDADKFVLSYLLISNKSQLCWISRLNSSQMRLRGGHSKCLINLLKIQNWAGNTEKRIHWPKVKWRLFMVVLACLGTHTTPEEAMINMLKIPIVWFSFTCWFLTALKNLIDISNLCSFPWRSCNRPQASYDIKLQMREFSSQTQWL